MRRLAIVLVLSLSACIAAPNLDHCGDQLCPRGLTCIDDVIAAVSASDVYVGGADVWVHHVGALTSSVRAVGTKLAATPDLIYSYDPVTTVISVIPRMRSRFASDGL